MALYDATAHVCTAGHVAVYCRDDHRINRVTGASVFCTFDEEVDKEKHVAGNASEEHDVGALQVVEV